jgi:hypothetical protein
LICRKYNDAKEKWQKDPARIGKEFIAPPLPPGEEIVSGWPGVSDGRDERVGEERARLLLRVDQLSFLSILFCMLRRTHTPSFAHSAPMRAEDFLE